MRPDSPLASSALLLFALALVLPGLLLVVSALIRSIHSRGHRR
jgi:hypothetical protein